MHEASVGRQKHKQRLRRQIAAFGNGLPWARRWTDWLLDDRTRIYRVPIGIGLILGGFVGFLPVFGFWMLPLGLLVLALDLPPLRPWVSGVSVRVRRRFQTWWRGRTGGPGR